jgi:hypothetical protein
MFPTLTRIYQSITLNLPPPTHVLYQSDEPTLKLHILPERRCQGYRALTVFPVKGRFFPLIPVVIVPCQGQMPGSHGY